MNFYWFHQPRTFMATMSCEYQRFSAGLPGVECPVCGNTWATVATQIAQELPLDHPLRSMSRRPISPEQLDVLAQEIIRTLSLSNKTLLPGADIGLLRLRCSDTAASDFEWPGRHKILINPTAHDVLLKNALTGWRPSPVIFEGTQNDDENPGVYQLLIEGRAGGAETSPDIQEVFCCSQCGFKEYNDPALVLFGVDQRLSDGSDFFRFDPPLNNYVFISNRAKLVMEAAGLKNYELSTSEEFILHYNQVGTALT